jgi:hypothetical protein
MNDHWYWPYVSAARMSILVLVMFNTIISISALKESDPEAWQAIQSDLLLFQIGNFGVDVLGIAMFIVLGWVMAPSVKHAWHLYQHWKRGEFGSAEVFDG